MNMGFFHKLSMGWGFMKEAFAIAKENRAILRPSLYSVFAGILYWIFWAGIFIGTDVDFETGGGKALGALATLGSFTIFYFFMGMTVHMVDVHLKGGQPNLSDAFADAKQNFIAILFLAMVSTAVEMVSKAVRKSSSESEGIGGAILFRMIASLIESVWTVMSFLLLPAIIIEDISLGNALRRVRDISKGNVMQIAIGEVGIRLLTTLIGFAMMLILFAFGYFSFGILGGTFGSILGIIVCGSILSLYFAFSSYLRMAYYTCLYLWAADLLEHGPQAKAPLPLARVIEQR